MKKTVLLTIVSLIIIMCSSISINAGHGKTVLIKTQDDQQQPINVDNIRWWFTDRPEHKQFLECLQTSCSDWSLDAVIDSEISVFAVASRPKDTDPLCVELYEGEARIQPGDSEITLTLSYSATACK